MLLLGLLACDPPKQEARIVHGTSIFTAGCPRDGESFARELTDPAEHLTGPDALGGPGETLLANAVAAFLISDPKNPKTYYQYGGIPIDAVPVSECEPSGPERFGEMGFVIGQLSLTDFPASQLRMIRGESVEIVNDGSDGKAAVVDVHGTDDRFWLIEMDLMRRSLESGKIKYLHDAWGLDVTTRYTLEPDSSVLEIEVILSGGEPQGYLIGTVLFPSDRTDQVAMGRGGISVGGVTLDTEVPWFGASDGQTAYAITMPGAAIARTKIAGVTAMIDLAEAAQPLDVGPGQSASGKFAISVAAGDVNAAVAPLCAVNEQPVPGIKCSEVRDSAGGWVRDPNGAAVAGADVYAMAQNANGDWLAFDRTQTDTSGFYGFTMIPIGPVQLVATADGRDPSPPMTPGGQVDLMIGALGELRYDIRDTDGNSVPALIELRRGDDVQRIYAAPGEGSAAVAPGAYTVSVTRGYEYEPVQTDVTVPVPDSLWTYADLPVTLEHVVDTDGWLSFDGHVHTEASADSTVLAADRARSAAAVGLEIIVDTDHEIVHDMAPGIAEAGLSDFVASVVSQEITATSPEHTNAWPFVPDADDPRGGPVKWYGLSLGQIFAAERERGAEVTVLNHPRIGCNFLCLIGWDRLTGEPTLTDHAALGLPQEEPLFSWDFDAVEYMNGPRDVLFHADAPDRSGFLDDWLAFLNLGHPVTALGVSDSHDPQDLAWPRTYVPSATDDPAQFDQDALIDGVLNGAAIVSAGAFAHVVAVTEGGSAGIGGMVEGADVDLAIEIEAPAAIDIASIVVLENCDEVARIDATGPNDIVKYDGVLSLHLERDAHLVVLAFGVDAMPAGLPDYDPTGVPRVTTNAIYVDADGNGVFDAPGGKTCTYGDGG